MFIPYFEKDVRIWEAIFFRKLSEVLVPIINHTIPWSLLNTEEVENKQMISLRYVNFWTLLRNKSFITIISELFLISEIKA